MEIKTYKKDLFYSYSLGAFPTIEMLKTHKKDALKVFIHSSFKNDEVIKMINDNRGESVVEFNDKMVNKLSQKENCFVVGVFKKYYCQLDNNEDHVVLVNPSNMGNLGTIIRSCLGFDIKNIAIIKPGVDFFDPKVIRASMGAIFSCNISFFASFDDYKNTFKDHQIHTFMLQASKSLQNTTFEVSKKTSLVFGNESSGLDISFLDENSIIIQHSNLIDSLNLPSSVAISLYEFKKQKANYK